MLTADIARLAFSKSSIDFTEYFLIGTLSNMESEKHQEKVKMLLKQEASYLMHMENIY